MRTLVCILILFSVIVGSNGEPAEDQKEILRLEDVITKAWAERDTALLGSIIADDFQYWSFKGVRKTKTDLLHTVEQGGSGNSQVEDRVARTYGDAAIYTARITDTGKDAAGKDFHARTCVTDVFVRRDGKWQLVASHETLLPPNP